MKYLKTCLQSLLDQDFGDYELIISCLLYTSHEQMEQKGQKFYMVQEAGETPGFVSVSHEAGRDVFIHKFYLDQQKAGKGLGSRVFAVLLELLQPVQIRLTVNRQNFKSINFYFKNGFVIERVADFDIGNGYVMNDFVMVWKKR